MDMVTTGAGRRPGDSRTRETIESAARTHFARDGFDKASVRAIASSAGVDPALVRHFFGGKAELFRAVIRFPIEPAAAVRYVADGERTKVGSRLAEIVADLVLDPARSTMAAAMLRSAATDHRVAGLVGDALLVQIVEPLVQSLAVDRPHLRGALASSQVMGFVVAHRLAVLAPLQRLERDEIVALLAPALQRYLIAPL